MDNQYGQGCVYEAEYFFQCRHRDNRFGKTQLIGIVLIVISWAFLKLEGLSLAQLGFNKPLQRLGEFTAGVIVAAGFAAGQYVAISYFADFSWTVNPAFGPQTLLDSLVWNVNSVLYEELLFRGYLLYKAAVWFGPKRACLLSAITFGIYHWFSYEILGQWIPMLYVFLLTGCFGLMFAYSYILTKSVVLPIALHLGWNIISVMIFSNGPLKQQMFVPDTSELALMTAYEQLLANLAIPFAFVALVFWVLTKKVKRDTQQ